MITQEKLTALYEKYSKELYIYIYGFVKSSQKAEDLLHDLFLKVINYSQKRALELDNIRAFLYKTARNLCIDFSRKNKRIQFSEIKDNLTTPENLETDFERDEFLEKVHSLIDKKSSFIRSVFYMKIELKMTYKEIADIMGVSERTVKRKMHSLLEYLAEQLEKSGFKDFNTFLLSLFL